TGTARAADGDSLPTVVYISEARGQRVILGEGGSGSCPTRARSGAGGVAERAYRGLWGGRGRWLFRRAARPGGGGGGRHLARGAHLQALRERGLRVRSVKGDFVVQVPATDDPAEVGSCDFVLFCVKTFDTDAAAARLGPLVGEGTAVMSLQNGVENEEKLA